ncbi:MAG: ComEA family DNA-binding protein [Methylophilaceae bacterium]|uniref:ComEA family DNA-binding protein n=1 Tax=Methylovorus sp. MM2 TaxID=1848038 RepID=UPI0007E18EFF|nr:helix-hairpin-helix domain-containing protein [Methylovorus sp. MM2]OAM52711.1 competence protein ComE [Methylovorus sp. MM2]
MRKIFLILLLTFAFSLPALSAVNINTATQDELQSVTGIGPKKSLAIIEYRKQHGAFKSINDLDNVKGFGPKIIEKIKDEISVKGGKADKAKSQ